MADYRVLEAMTFRELEDSVNRFLDAGFTLAGGVAYHDEMNGYKTRKYIQAVVKYKTQNEEN